ncbi:MAG: hypothetical protein EXS50_00395 [Candidatus Taylorbacteria bacterium]|nr:hypothetical protein [Candidatus Taylorbacteria bacterium]
MKTYLRKNIPHVTSRRFVISVMISFLLLIASIIINFYAGTFAAAKASNSVTDLVLDNIKVYNVTEIFIFGPLFMWIFVTILCLKEPRRIPFVLKNIAFFVLIRSIFITMTHIGPYPDHLILGYNTRLLTDFTFGGDLFFSAHTGLPFLMALVFGKNIYLRIIFFCASVFFGAIVLMAHLHYTIDVLSAFFITYTIYHIAKFLFRGDEKMFNEVV